jgi:hypothetical protein
MHIKNIHCMIEKLAEVAKCELDRGIEDVDTKELGEVADIIKDLSEAEYYAKISKAMDESEYGKDYDEYGAYDEPRYYRGQPRDSRGRYMRRGYEMTPEMYRKYPAEHYRDMDREHGRMYYTEGGANMGEGTGNSPRMYSEMGRDRREGRSGMSRRTYMETKEMGKEHGEKMKTLEQYMKELSADVTEMIQDASQEEKAMLKNKMQVLMQKF